jgi:LPXTG-motif cell wall-anchored protein
LAVVGVSLTFLFGPGATAAMAEGTPEQEACPINSFIESDGTTIDFTAYSACVDAFNSQSAALPRTGPSTDIGQFVGLGAGLIALGAAFMWTARRNRVRVNS